MSIELNGGIMTGVVVHYCSFRNISRTSQEGLRESRCLIDGGSRKSRKYKIDPDPSPLLSRIICRWKDLQIPLWKKGIYKYRSWKLRTSGQDWNQKQAHLISGIRKSEYSSHGSRKENWSFSNCVKRNTITRHTQHGERSAWREFLNLKCMCWRKIERQAAYASTLN